MASLSSSPGVSEGPASATTPIADAIGFLRSKGVLADDETAEMRFALLLNPTEALTTQRQKYYVKSQERLLRLYRAISSAHEACAEGPPSGAHVFSDAEFPGYETLPMLHDSKMRMQRWQQSRLCYMHAPVIAQYYAIWHKLCGGCVTTSSHGVLDVARFIADHFSAKQLEHHVFEDSGGSSVRFLRAILEPGSVVVATDSSRLKEYLALYGPGLVSGFEVHADFEQESVHKHYGSPTGESIGQHAMVLMGVRSDLLAGEERCILQTWYVCRWLGTWGIETATNHSRPRFFLLRRWLHKQFVEVSPSYLDACGATVYFIKTPQTRVPEGFSRHAPGFHWQEMEADMPEGDVMEDL